MRRALIAVVEVVILSALIVATRCANYHDVFIGGDVYFTDADCYARMTRVRICVEHPGMIVRHHSFENFPDGTNPHTTAPLDYLIVILGAMLGGAFDLAGAIVSPLLAIMLGWFLWWWSRRMRLGYRAVLLLLFAVSPILVHATELGRPDHQSLLLALVTLAICAEWTLTAIDSRAWSLISGVAWGLALWVSLYEPLILLGIIAALQMIAARKTFLRPNRLVGWTVCVGIVLVAMIIERRLPSWPSNGQIFANWAATIGELRHVPLNDPIWLRWSGLLLIPFPALLWIALQRMRTMPIFVFGILVAGFALTMWQARWACFFVMIFALSVPVCLSAVRNRLAGWIVVFVSLFPILKDWDERLWPNEWQSGLAAERRAEKVGWHQAAKQIDGPFLAPWWWSPAVAYWSGQPGIAGSSHEALPGIEQSARFFLAADAEQAKTILAQTRVSWVLAYDGDRIVANSAAILGVPPPENAIGRILDRTPSQAQPFLQLSMQNSTCKLFRVHFFQVK